MMLLLIGFRFSYDDWGSMITIFFTIASPFIEIDAAMRTKSFTSFFAQVYERVFDDQKLTHILDRVDLFLAGEVEDPVDIKRKLHVFLF